MWSDLRYSWRFLRSKPFFTFAVVATLALGIGVNTAMFAIVYSVLLRPLPYQNSQQLVRISDTQGRDITPFSFEEFQNLANRPAALQSIAGYFEQSYILTRKSGAENVSVLRASVALLQVLGIRPSLGPGFSRTADNVGAEREVMLSEELWRKDYGGDPHMIGKIARLGEDGYTIVGILPATFRFVKGVDMLLPLRLSAAAAPPGYHFLSAVGRMRAGFTPETTAAALRPTQAPASDGAHGVRVVGLQQDIVASAKLPALLLFGATCLILLIASANVANLLLVRAIGRRKEMAVRMALGAGRVRIARQLLTECAALSLAGGAAGVLLASFVLRWARTSASSLLPRSEEVSLQLAVLLFTGAMSVVAALLLNLGPALQARIENLDEPLRSARQSGPSAAARRWQDRLVAAEVALTVMLLCATGLLVRSFAKVITESKGFAAERVFSLSCNLTEKYNDPQRLQSFYEEVRQRLTGMAWVESVGLVTSVPLTGSPYGTVRVSGEGQPGNGEYTADKILADGGYFTTLKIPVVAGRLFSNRDSARSAPVAIIDQTFARQACGGNRCLGRMIDFGWGKDLSSEVVGIVGPVRQEGLETKPRFTVYLPIAQKPELLGDLSLTVLARTSLEPKSASAEFRAAILALDKYQPPPTIETMTGIVDSSIMTRKLVLTLLSSIAALAVLLAILGVYATMSYAVATRAAEFGLRMALGARQSDLLLLILRHGTMLAVSGLVLGFAGAIASTRFLGSILYGTSPFDLLTFAAVGPFVALMVLTAAWLPGRTALAVDPSSALKCE